MSGRPYLRTLRNLLIERDGAYCYYCGIALVKPEDYSFPKPMPNRMTGYGFMTVDHKISLSKGGRTSLWNCVLACQECNCVKANLNMQQAQKAIKKRLFK